MLEQTKIKRKTDSSGAMTADELQNIVCSKIKTSQTWLGDNYDSNSRELADRYYRGELLGNEREGWSQVVSRDVAEVVDGMLPSLIRVFAGGENVVEFKPTNENDEEAAQQATDYVNHVFLKQNKGIGVLYTWFLDALLKKNGIVKVYWESRQRRCRNHYSGLTQEQMAALTQDPDVQVSNIQAEQDVVVQMNPQTGMQEPVPVDVYSCTVVKMEPEEQVRVANVPPDEFFIESRAVSLEDAVFLGQRAERTTSDLIECGYDPELVMNIPDSSGFDHSGERNERFNDEVYDGRESDHKSMRRVVVVEAFIKVDYDGDGYAEWRKVTLGGDTSHAVILDNEEVDGHHFASITPYIEPHRFFGQSVFEKTKDIQDIKTSLLRNLLDNQYLANNPRITAVDGQVNVDDLLNSRPGGIVRQKNPNACGLLAVPNVAMGALSAIEKFDGIREQRTGVTRYNQGLDSNTLNKTASGIKIISNAAQQRMELIARMFAETGVAQLFQLIFKLICQNQQQGQMVRLRDKFVQVNPRDWHEKMDVNVSVGVGLGDKSQQLQSAMQVLEVHKQIVQMQGGVQGPLVTLANLHKALIKLADAVGMKNPETYFTDPAMAQQQQQQQQGPSPEEQKAQLELEKTKLDLQGKALDLKSKNLDFEVKKLESGAKAVTALAQTQPRMVA
jgi:hypothetical protein